MQAIYVPSIPPASAFEAYLLLLIIPFVFRLVMVVPPLFDIISKYGGDAKWFWGRIRQIRIKGLSLLIFNEVISLILPVLLAIFARSMFDPVGCPDWEATPSTGVFILFAFFATVAIPESAPSGHLAAPSGRTAPLRSARLARVGPSPAAAALATLGWARCRLRSAMVRRASQSMTQTANLPARFALQF